VRGGIRTDEDGFVSFHDAARKVDRIVKEIREVAKISFHRNKARFEIPDLTDVELRRTAIKHKVQGIDARRLLNPRSQPRSSMEL
jgi:hypothetical protein